MALLTLDVSSLLTGAQRTTSDDRWNGAPFKRGILCPHLYKDSVQGRFARIPKKFFNFFKIVLP
jgi:hypothetical protein